MVERGLVGKDEIAAGCILKAARPSPRILRADDVVEVLAKGTPTERIATTPAGFAVGEQVRMQQAGVAHHTRLPGYAKGKIGRIERVHGVHVFADTNAHGLGEQPQWLYTVVFEGSELWGEDVARDFRVSIDAWQPYLEGLA
jgi:nitrile hydratase